MALFSDDDLSDGRPLYWITTHRPDDREAEVLNLRKGKCIPVYAIKSTLDCVHTDRESNHKQT